MHNTSLNDRILWFDGVSAFDPSRLLEVISKYPVTHVTKQSDIVDTFNKHVSSDKELRVKTACNPISLEWNLPDEYKHLDVCEYVYSKHVELTKALPATEISLRDVRLVTELVKYKECGLFDALRAIIWTINTLVINDVVWGVGRGSSVSSYVLYVIGVHDVDSFAYELDVDDFLHE